MILGQLSLSEYSLVSYNVANLSYVYAVPEVIDFPRYNMKSSGENLILRGIFHVQYCSFRFSSTVHFMLYRGNLECFSNSGEYELTHRLREFVTKTSALGVLVIESYGPNQMTAKYLGDIFVKNILQTCLLV